MDTLIAAREMRALVWTDVDLEKGQLRIERARQHIKCGRLRYVAMPPSKNRRSQHRHRRESENAPAVNESKG